MALPGSSWHPLVLVAFLCVMVGRDGGGTGVRTLPEQGVTLKRAQNNYLEVKSGAAEFRIVGLPAEDFPALDRELWKEPVAEFESSHLALVNTECRRDA